MKATTKRRVFLGAMGAAVGNRARATAGPNGTIHLGLIGCGARGRGMIVPQFSKVAGTKFTAVCDVNSK